MEDVKCMLESQVSEMDSFWWWQDSGCDPGGGWLIVSGETASERRDQEDKACAPPNAGLQQRYCFLPSDRTTVREYLFSAITQNSVLEYWASCTAVFYSDHDSSSYCTELERFPSVSSVGSTCCLIHPGNGFFLSCPALWLSLLSLTNSEICLWCATGKEFSLPTFWWGRRLPEWVWTETFFALRKNDVSPRLVLS